MGSDIYWDHLIESFGCDPAVLVYDKYCGTTGLLKERFPVAFERFNCVINHPLTEEEKSVFRALYTDLPGVLTESIAELDCSLELRSQVNPFFANLSKPKAKNGRSTARKSSTRGKVFTERGEQWVNRIEKPLSRELWNQLLSLGSSFMGNDQLRLDFFICVMRQIWSSPAKQTVLSDSLKCLGFAEVGSISVDRMLPYYVYHQIAINSIVMWTNAQYHIAFLRIPQGARYSFIVTDNPVIDISEESKNAEAKAASCYLGVISPSLALIVSDQIVGKTRFVNERETAMYNTLLFKKANRYVVSNRERDIFQSCC